VGGDDGHSVKEVLLYIREGLEVVTFCRKKVPRRQYRHHRFTSSVSVPLGVINDILACQESETM
jgi:hypothetical protein